MNSLPAYMDLTNIEWFREDLYQEIYKGIQAGKYSILVVFSIIERKFRIRTGQYVRDFLLNNEMLNYYNDVKALLETKNYSKAVLKFTDSLENYFRKFQPRYKDGNGSVS